MKPIPAMARTAVAVIATTALALLAPACAGNPSSTGSGSPSAAGSKTSQLLAFARCMRSHGVTTYPDPDPTSGNLKVNSAEQLGVSSSQLQTAVSACQHLLPPGADDRFPAAEVQLMLPGMLKFSQCMRSHGVSNFPDPSTDSEGRPIFDLSDAGFSRAQTHAPQFDTLMHECEHLLPPPLGGIPLG